MWRQGEETISMKRTAVILLALISMLTICGCGLWGKEDAWEHMELTQEEKDLLCKLYIDEEKINQGELFSYQVRTVEQYRYAKEVLARKYPSYEFKITYCEPQTIADKYMMLYFGEVENGEVGETVYTMYVYEGKKEYYAKDDFFDRIFSPIYETFLYDNLQNIGGNIVEVKSCMPFVEGEEYDENVTIEDMISGKVTISSDTSIYLLEESISEKEWEEIFSNIKEKVVQELGLEGTYEVMVINNDESLEKIEENIFEELEYSYKGTFHTWEEKK